jgi:acetyl esterase/lipase
VQPHVKTFVAHRDSMVMKTKTLLLLAFVLASTFTIAQQPPARPNRAEARRAPALPEGTKALRHIAYVTNGHERQILDLFIPPGATGRLPLIIWVHGGAWKAGSKENCPALRYLQRGYAVASINYRLSQHAIFPAQIEDCKAAVRWLRAHANEHNLDPDRFAAWGSSAGGHLVALLGTSGEVKAFDVGANLAFPSRVQAVVDFFGPTDFTQMSKFAPPNAPFDHDATDSPESLLIGGAVQQNKDKAAKASPISYVSKDDPPFLIMHGDKDNLVPYQQSELLRDALRKSGVPVTLKIIEGAGHGFGGPDIDRQVADFFAKHFKPAAKP